MQKEMFLPRLFPIRNIVFFWQPFLSQPKQTTHLSAGRTIWFTRWRAAYIPEERGIIY